MPRKGAVNDRWRYIVLVAKCSVHALINGIVRSLSVLIPSLVFQLNTSIATIGFLVSFQVGILNLASPISNFLSRHFGLRPVATIGGFLAAISLITGFFCQSAEQLGCCLAFSGLFASPIRLASYETLHQHFKENFGMAEAITQMGGQLGGIVFPYLTSICLYAYGVRGALLFLGGLAMHYLATGAAMIPPRSWKETEVDISDANMPLLNSSGLGEFARKSNEIMLDETEDQNMISSVMKRRSKDPNPNSNKAAGNRILDMLELVWCSLDLKSLKNEPVFTLVFLPCQCLFDIGFAGWTFFMVSYAVSEGWPEEKAVYLPMAGSLGSFIGGIVLIGVLHKFPRHSLPFYTTCVGITSISLFAYSMGSSLIYLVICSFIAGVGFYAAYSCFYAALASKISNENFAGVMAYSFFFYGIIISTSAFVTGYLYDWCGSFPLVFSLLGAVQAIVCAFFTIYIFIDSRKK